jgi:hypothetical protein
MAAARRGWHCLLSWKGNSASTARREYKSKDAAGQLDASPYEFTGLSASSPLLWLAKGWAVLSGPSMPIVAEGEGAEPNDTYVDQLVGELRPISCPLFPVCACDSWHGWLLLLCVLRVLQL